MSKILDIFQFSEGKTRLFGKIIFKSCYKPMNTKHLI